MLCHYEVLGLDRAQPISGDDIKRAYKKSALKWHPDRNHGNEEEATLKFKGVSAAFSVLSDPQERKWYDDHRESILRGKDGTKSGNEDTEGDAFDNTMDLWQYFNAACFNDFDDEPEGFYKVYTDVYNDLCVQENEKMPAGQGLVDYPPFGDSTTDWKDVTHFYNQWTNFVSVMSFGWEDEYNPAEAPTRDVRRQIEKTNKKSRDAGRKKYVGLVHQLVAYCRKRDPRMKAIEAHREALEQEKAEARLVKKMEEMERRKVERERRMALLDDEEEQERRNKEYEGAYLLAEESSDEEEGGGWGDIGGKVRRRRKKSGKGGNQKQQQQFEQQRQENTYQSDHSSDEEMEMESAAATTTQTATEGGEKKEEGEEEKENEKEEEVEKFCCEICTKSFLQEAQLNQHNNSKAHKQAIKDNKKRFNHAKKKTNNKADKGLMKKEKDTKDIDNTEKEKDTGSDTGVFQLKGKKSIEQEQVEVEEEED